MIAYQLYGQQDIRLEEIDDPDVQPNDVKIRVAHNGICGTDLHYFFANEREGWIRPRCIGHELSGTVTEVGTDVIQTDVGDRVCVYPIDSCGVCSQCQAGYAVLCEQIDRAVSTVGCGAPFGGLAEYCVIPSRLVVPLPDELTLSQGALVEPLAVATTAVQRAHPEPGQVTVVLGGGPIGIGTVLALEAFGITNVIVVEPSLSRRTALSRLTRGEVLDPNADDVRATVRSHSEGRGADIVFECAGVPASLASALELVRKRGRIVLIGLFEVPFTFQPNQLCIGETTIVGHNGSTRASFDAVIDFMRSARYPTTEDWVVHVPWENLVSEGFEPLRRAERIKVLIDVPQ